MTAGQWGSVRRFDGKAGAYAAYRPHYPEELLALLRTGAALAAGDRIVDVGAGTGHLTRMFAAAGHAVWAVEPNAEMAAEARRTLADFPNAEIIVATGESTGLGSRCADLWICAQAFHWLDATGAREEARRILRGDGRAVILWNRRATDRSALMAELEALIKRWCLMEALRPFSPAALSAFYGGTAYEMHVLGNQQTLDWSGLCGRVASMTFMPSAGHPNHEPMRRELRALFERHASNDDIALTYDTEVLVGRVR